MNLLSNVVMTKALISQCFTNDLQVGHSRHPHVGETPRRPKHFFEHRNGVLLISTNAERMNQRAVDVPEEDAKIWRGRGEWETRRRREFFVMIGNHRVSASLHLRVFHYSLSPTVARTSPEVTVSPGATFKERPPPPRGAF